jgi:hypothetical protein
VRGNTGYGSKALSQTSAESQMVDYLCNVRPILRDAITADRLVATYNVSRKVAEYRLQLAQMRWAAE